MQNQIVRHVIGIILGVAVGVIVMTGLHMASLLIYTPPEDVDFWAQGEENIAKINAWVSTLPAGAFLLATVAHALGAMSGAITAMLVTRREQLGPAIIIGVMFTIAGIMNLASMDHPGWFPFVDLPSYMLLAVGAGLVLRKKPSEPAEPETAPEPA